MIYSHHLNSPIRPTARWEIELCICLLLSICTCFVLSAFLSMLYLSIYLPLYRSLDLSSCLPIRRSTRRPVGFPRLSIFLSSDLSMHLCQCVHLSNLSVSVHPSIPCFTRFAHHIFPSHLATHLSHHFPSITPSCLSNQSHQSTNQRVVYFSVRQLPICVFIY